MISVVGRELSAQAVQLSPATLSEFRARGVVVQESPLRAYVPVSWGTVTLEEDDWLVEVEQGFLLPLTTAQYVRLFRADTSDQLAGLETAEPEDALLVYNLLVTDQIGRDLEMWIERYNFDYIVLTGGTYDRSSVVKNATGETLVTMKPGDQVRAYSDGRIEVAARD